MTALITAWQTTSILIVVTETTTKITLIATREAVSTVMKATATVATIAVAKDGYLLTSSVNHKYIVKVRSFLLAKTIDMLDYIKPTQRFQSRRILTTCRDKRPILQQIP